MPRMIATLALVMMCGGASLAHAQAPVADYFSTTSQLHGVLLPAGTLIEAFDSDGIRCGVTEAKADGSFLIQVYGNDPMTAGIDEGAREGEMLDWRIDGQSVDAVEWLSNIVGLFADVRFENGAAKEIFLSVAPTAVEEESWSTLKGNYRE